MEFKTAYLLTIVYISLTNIVVFTLKYGHVSDCFFYNGSGHKVTLICAENDNEDKVFATSEHTVCLNSILMENHWPNVVNFEQCRFPSLSSNFFLIFPNIQTFIIPNVELESLQIHIFREGKNLRHLIASNNRLVEFPSRLFADENQIIHIDLSYNKIKIIDPEALDGATSLETLNLAHNQLTRLDPHILHYKAPNLSLLDLSHNHLRNLSDKTFETSFGLKHLDLSYNFIGNLRFGTLSCLYHLEHLNLKSTNMSYVQPGTFTYQQRLVSLDLSENKLRKINFHHSMPIQCHLKSLRLNKNRLKELKGLRNGLLPRLNLLDIQDNKFNCTYLQHFMKHFNFDNIHLVANPRSADPRKPNIRGINCEVITGNGTDCQPQTEKSKIWF